MRVLVADDDEDVLFLYRRKLQGRGHEVFEARDGRQALQEARDCRPDVLVLDVMMPGPDGFAVLEELAAEGLVPELPVVMVSARIGVEDRRRGLRGGASGYVTKPFDPDALVSLVEELGDHDVETRSRMRETALRALSGDGETEEPAVAGGETITTFQDVDPRLVGIVELAVDAIVSVDEEQNIVGFNKGAERLFGYVAEEVMGKRLDMLLPPAAVEIHRQHMQGFARSGEVARPMGARRPVYGRRRDGGEFPVEASIIKHDINGRPSYTAILRDATERHRAEAELRARAREQEAVASLGQRALSGLALATLMDEVVAVLAEVLEVDYAAVLALDRDGELLTMLAGWGWRPGAVGGTAFGAGASVRVGGVLRSDGPTVIENVHTQTGQDVAPLLAEHDVVSAMTTSIRGARSPFGMLGVYTRAPRRFGPDQANFLQSVANVLAAAIERDRTETQLRGFLDAAPDATLLVDADGQIVSANAQVEALFGYTRQELVGTGVDKLVPDSVRAAHSAHRASYATEPRTRPMGVGLDLYARRRDGTEVPVDIMLSPLHTDAGPLVVAAVRDVTERRRTDAVRDAFLHAVSHELRTPLTGVLGFASMLAGEDMPPEEVKDLASRVVANATKLERLLSDLLDLDRLSRGVIEPRRRPTDLGALTRGVVRSIGGDARPISVDVEPDPLVADIDPAHVERTVENLLANAFRHTPEGTQAWVRARQGPNGVLVIVEDDGPGIPEDQRRAVFEPFQRGGAASHTPGTGIGLSLVAKFAELHGGRAWVEEREGGGASFRVLFAAP